MAKAQKPRNRVRLDGSVAANTKLVRPELGSDNMASRVVASFFGFLAGFKPKKKDMVKKPMFPYDVEINRWTGKPHEHRREIDRRLSRATV